MARFQGGNDVKDILVSATQNVSSLVVEGMFAFLLIEPPVCA